jgi:hypothetical protein
LRCKITVDGLVIDCVVIAEQPKNLGFGDAALSMAPLFRMKPFMRDGVPEGGAQVVIPINFGCENSCSPSGNISTVKLYRLVPWIEAPTAAQVVAAYPPKARKDQMRSGLISIRCTIGVTGLLINCDTSGEAPAGEGLAAAAYKLSKDFKAPLKDIQGNAMRGSQVLLSFAFAPRMLDDPASARGRPVIVETLVGAESAAVFPEKAKAAHIGFGEVAAICVVGDGGSMTKCKIQNETPLGMDFAEAAQKILDHTRASLWSEDGLPTLGAAMTLRIPMGDEKARGAQAQNQPR